MNDLRSGTCPSCNHNEVIEASPTEEGRDSDESNHLGLVRDYPEPFGQLWTYTCRQCGLTQWVAAKPAEVPIGPEHGTRLIIGPAPQPFR